jgi:hypothetical protein
MTIAEIRGFIVVSTLLKAVYLTIAATRRSKTADIHRGICPN